MDQITIWWHPTSDAGVWTERRAGSTHSRRVPFFLWKTYQHMSETLSWLDQHFNENCENPDDH